MHRFFSLSQPLLSFMACAPPPPVLAPRVFPLMAAPSAHDRRIFRFPHWSRNMASISEIKDDESCKLGSRISSANDHYAVTQVMKNIETRDINKEVIANFVDGRQEDSRSVIYDHQVILLDSDDEEMHYLEDVFPLRILRNSRHCDGSIHGTIWNKLYHISDRTETCLEAKMNSESTADCFLHNGSCIMHPPRCMLQIFSLKLAKVPVNSGSLELYGYIAVRDNLDRLLNYVIHFSRDDPIIVEQGSLINMNGPKRAILLLDTIVIEFDLKIKMGEQENDDLQLIDGLSAIDHIGVWNCRTLTRRIHGHCGAVDITFLRLHHSVEGTVEVSISDVQSSFSFCLGCFINRLNDEIRLFDGTIGEPSVLQRSVVAVPMDSWMELKFKVGSGPSSFSEACSFKANNHGLATQQIKTDFAVISVKVTWSTLSLNLETT
ncbi:hypothetical protein ACQ4PT_061489 [Festuca glaucescens]